MNQRALALGFAGLAVASGVFFVVLGAVCGAKEVSKEAEPGSDSGPERCVPVVTPFEYAYLAFALGGFAGVWSGRRWAPLALGLPLVAWGLIDAVGIGLFALPTGLLLSFSGGFDPRRSNEAPSPGQTP